MSKEEQLLYEQYLKLQSKELKEEIVKCESFNQLGHAIAIKVTFTWGWLRVYRTKGNGIEWY